jgi:hypothetical protein
LETQQEYNGFKEWLQTFELYRGKKTGDDLEDESRVVGIFKASLWHALFIQSYMYICHNLILYHANMAEHNEIKYTLLHLIYWNIVCIQYGAFRLTDLKGEYLALFFLINFGSYCELGIM